ncbi:MAG: DegT/DnrJ/EryC1/StrS family aminotransferase [Bryobacteraceae bacterium]|nr:DegT/DnrJ/EryC1/StrS family aminotransferase [Bryobacteraceae bacterium]
MATTRRTFLAAASAATTAAGAFQETLAMNGGPKAVTYAPARASALSKWPRYGAAEKQVLHDLIDSGRFYQELPAFEKEWQDYTKAPFVKAHMNGTSAITSMYFALDLPPGSEVMVPSYTFFSPCLALRFFGLVPIFIDIDPKTATFDLEDAKRKLTPRTKAVEVMHSWGMPCQMDAISAWAKEKGLILLEDSAHAHGASFHGRKMGTFGEMAIYSYQLSKVMPAIEGGMGMYRSRAHFERASAFGHYEDPVKFAADSPVRAYEGTGFGQKYRMHPLAAAIARIQLRSLDERNGVARKNVAALNGRVTQLAAVAEPKVPGGAERVYYNGNMLLIDFAKLGVSRDTIVKALKAEGVPASFWDYPEQHKLKIYSEAKWWHHAPKIPEKMPGNAWINSNHIFVPCQYGEAPDLIEQYAKAFEKVWAHRKQLAGA